MKTRQKPRKNINLPGRYFTGLGDPVDVLLADVSEGGCRFEAGPQRLVIGSPLQIFVAGSGPHRAAVRWIDNGEVGVTFASPLATELLQSFKASHVPDLSDDATPGDFASLPDSLPHRFC